MQEPSEDKSQQNRRDIHDFSEKVSQIADTFEKLRFWTKKVSKFVRTFEKVISKVKKTDGFLKVICRKCDRGLRKLTSGTPIQSYNNNGTGSGGNHSVETK